MCRTDGFCTGGGYLKSEERTEEYSKDVYKDSLFTFDFTSLSWSLANLTGASLHPRWDGMVAYHGGALVGMGGGH